MLMACVRFMWSTAVGAYCPSRLPPRNSSFTSKSTTFSQIVRSMPNRPCTCGRFERAGQFATHPRACAEAEVIASGAP
jgi:hypothetical protein